MQENKQRESLNRGWSTSARGCLTALALIAALPLVAGPAQARMIRSTRIDTDADVAAMTVIGTVASLKVVKKRVKGPYSSMIAILELRVRVVVPVTNSRPGQVVKVRHPRLLPSQFGSANGFHPAVLEKGRTYLLFLKARKDGRYELLTVEDSSLVAFTRPVLSKLPRKSKAPAVERVVDALSAVVAKCSDDCMGAIWLLDRSRVFAKRHALVSGHKRAFIANLLRVTKRSKDSNTLNAAYTVLGRMGVRSVVPTIVAYLCRRPPKSSKTALSNSISWLQGFPKEVEAKALRQVIAKAADPGVVKTARYRLKWITSH